MAESNIDQGRNKKKERDSTNPLKRNIALLFLLLLFISSVVYFYSDIHWIEITFAHLGAFGIVGLLGCCTGLIAMKKGYGYWKAFLIGMFSPIFLGIGAVLLFQPVSCGGSVSLAVAIIILVTYSLLKRKIVVNLI
jgi:hypothetical protein